MVLDGRIRPDVDSGLSTFDVWASYQPPPERRQSTEAPHVELANIPPDFLDKVPEGRAVASLSEEEQAHNERVADWLASDGCDAIVRWCERFGLLGLGIHNAIALRGEYAPCLLPTIGGREVQWLERPLYRRSTHGWSHAQEPAPHQLPVTPGRETPRRDGAPGVLQWEPEYGDCKWEPMSRLYPFLPSLAAESPTDAANSVVDLPCPLSPDWWNAYCEPVHSFLVKARVIKRALREWQRWVKRGASRRDGDRSLHAALRELHALTAGVRLVVAPSSDGNLVEMWSAPSMLAHCAMMVTQDMAHGGHVFRCQGCGRLRVSGLARTKYCGNKCRDVQRSARSRALKKLNSESKKARDLTPSDWRRIVQRYTSAHEAADGTGWGETTIKRHLRRLNIKPQWGSAPNSGAASVEEADEER